VVQCEARRCGSAVLRCVQEDLNSSSPALEIPEWMFDSGHCGGMKQDSLAFVSSAALLALTVLLSPAADAIESSASEAQHLSRSSGDADAHEAIQEQPRRVIFSTGEAAGVATGSTPEDDPPFCQDAERASAEAPFVRQQSAAGGGR